MRWSSPSLFPFKTNLLNINSAEKSRASFEDFRLFHSQNKDGSFMHDSLRFSTDANFRGSRSVSHPYTINPFTQITAHSSPKYTTVVLWPPKKRKEKKQNKSKHVCPDNVGLTLQYALALQSGRMLIRPHE